MNNRDYRKMGKKDFIKILARYFSSSKRQREIKKQTQEDLFLTEEQVSRLSNKVIDYISTSLQEGQRVEIRGFGSFFAKTHDTRILKGPHSGDMIEIPERRLPRFKAGKLLKQKANQTRSQRKST